MAAPMENVKHRTKDLYSRILDRTYYYWVLSRICILLYKSLIKCIARYVDKQQLSLYSWMLRTKTVQILCQNGMYIFKEEFEDTTKGVIRICKSKDRQHNGQKKKTDNTMAKRRRTDNDPRNITHKTKDRVTRTSLKYIFLVIIFWLKTTKSYTLYVQVTAVTKHFANEVL